MPIVKTILVLRAWLNSRASGRCKGIARCHKAEPSGRLGGGRLRRACLRWSGAMRCAYCAIRQSAMVTGKRRSTTKIADACCVLCGERWRQLPGCWMALLLPPPLYQDAENPATARKS